MAAPGAIAGISASTLAFGRSASCSSKEAVTYSPFCSFRALIRSTSSISRCRASSTRNGLSSLCKDKDGHGYVLADISGRYPPTEWARLAIAAYATHRADRIVAEVNNGGDMVGATLRMIDPNVAFTAVRASRGKVVRAEPVAALYQQGRVHHIGTFPQLEDQMTNFTSDIDRAAAGYSPDRVDALVWAFSELLVEPMESAGIYELYRRNAEAAEQRDKPQPTKTVYAPGSMEWLAEQKKSG